MPLTVEILPPKHLVIAEGSRAKWTCKVSERIKVINLYKASFRTLKKNFTKYFFNIRFFLPFLIIIKNFFARNGF